MTDEQRNQLSGHADEVMQARDVHGGVHFHGRGGDPEPVPRQLPADVRGFVNRAGDLAQLDEVLEEGPDPVTACVVVGTAGVGKTSLAVRWAHRVAGRFPDGQLYVNLHGYDPGPPVTPPEVLDRFLRALNVPGRAVPADLESRAALFRSLLAGRRMLVVLDNAATVGQVRPLLPGGSGCLVLVTSRGSLTGLVARDGARRVSLSVLTPEEATALLRGITAGYRAQDDAAELAELARLCARLPLALRIAAERAINRPRMPLRELIAELRDESGLWDALTADDDDESDAVRTVFAWSYRALPPEAGRLFRLLGLHPGPDFGSAAAAALAGLPVARTRRVLDDLVCAHLLEQPSQDRYQFHDLLRMYATDQARAEEPPETALAVTRRVLLWYLHTTAAAGETMRHETPPALSELEHGVTPLRFSERVDAVEWYRLEKANLATAVRTADELGFTDIAWQLPAVLYPIYARYNQFDDWIASSSLALETVRRLGDRLGEARMLESLGKAHTQYLSRGKGVEFQSAALAIREELGDLSGAAGSTNALGLARLRGHELAEALSLFRRVAELAAGLPGEYWSVIATGNIGNTLLEFENFQQSQELLEDALSGYRRLGIRGSEGDTLRALSHTHRGLGEPQVAREFADQALVIARQDENPAWEAFWLLELGRVRIDLGEPAEALTAFQRAASLQRQLGDRVREAEAFDATGTAYQALDRPEQAADFHLLATTAFLELTEDWLLALALAHHATALASIGRPGDAAVKRREALSLLARFDDPRALRLRRALDALR